MQNEKNRNESVKHTISFRFFLPFVYDFTAASDVPQSYRISDSIVIVPGGTGFCFSCGGAV